MNNTLTIKFDMLEIIICLKIDKIMSWRWEYQYQVKWSTVASKKSTAKKNKKEGIKITSNLLLLKMLSSFSFPLVWRSNGSKEPEPSAGLTMIPGLKTKLILGFRDNYFLKDTQAHDCITHTALKRSHHWKHPHISVTINDQTKSKFKWAAFNCEYIKQQQPFWAQHRMFDTESWAILTSQYL